MESYHKREVASIGANPYAYLTIRPAGRLLDAIIAHCADGWIAYDPKSRMITLLRTYEVQR